MPCERRVRRLCRSTTPPCRFAGTVPVGIREAFGTLYSEFGWDRLLGARRMSANRILKEMVLARLQAPASKRRTVRDLADHGDVALNLDHVYKTMDHLDDGVVEALCDRSLALARGLYDKPIGVLFYDTTTLYFESERADALREKGYSKDSKPHRVQIVFALLVTPDGIPCGYQVFPGKIWEGQTLIDAMAALRARHPQARFTVVADAGLLNSKTCKALSDSGISYILGARLKSADAAKTAKILDPDDFERWSAASDPSSDAADTVSKYKELPFGEDRLIVTWSANRAKRDAEQRNEALDRLRKQIKNNGQPSAISQRRHARFLKFPKGRVAIDSDKVADAARWDGLGGIVAQGLDDADARDLVRQYRGLWEIEACFRTNKHDLKIRPVFHWVPRRIRAHIAICYMAFCCLQHLRYRLAARGSPMSPDAIRHALSELGIGVLHRNPGGGPALGLPTQATPEARQIYRCLGLIWNQRPFPIAERRRPRKDRT